MTLQNIQRISEIFLASIALSERVFSRFKRFLRLSSSRDIDFFNENRFWQVVSFSMKQRRQKVWEFINFHVNKNNKGSYCESSLLQKLTDAGNLPRG